MLLECGDRVRGQILKPDAVVGDLLQELRVALNQRDQTFEHLVGYLRVGECDRRFHGVPPCGNWVSLFWLSSRLTAASLLWSNQY